jgi:hypothetical protein
MTLAIHFMKSYATTACSYYVGQSQMTADPAKVTCGICVRTRAFRVASTACSPEVTS